VPALQIAVGVNPLFNIGLGLTLTTTEYVEGFEQPFALKLITYVTSIGAAVVLVNISDIEDVVPLLAVLDIPITEARLQLNDTPLVELVAV
jgi:hypothetical protein